MSVFNPLGDVLGLISGPAGPLNILSILFLILEVLYAVFAIIIVRQVQMLNNAFRTENAFIFTFFSYAHLFIALILVILSVLSI
jgi:hypothetical protein